MIPDEERSKLILGLKILLVGTNNFLVGLRPGELASGDAPDATVIVHPGRRLGCKGNNDYERSLGFLEMLLFGVSKVQTVVSGGNWTG